MFEVCFARRSESRKPRRPVRALPKVLVELGVYRALEQFAKQRSRGQTLGAKHFGNVFFCFWVMFGLFLDDFWMIFG